MIGMQDPPPQDAGVEDVWENDEHQFPYSEVRYRATVEITLLEIEL